MKKLFIMSLSVLALSNITTISFALSWGDIGNAFSKAGDAIKDTATDVGNKINDNVIKPLTAGWEKKREIGRLLEAGAKQLEDAPQLLQDQAVNGLQTGLVDGIKKSLMTTLIAKTADIAAKRAEIAKFKKMVQDNQDMATQLGKASLVTDLLDGFNAADEALAMLWSGSNLQQTVAPVSTAPTKTAFGALRQKLVTTAQLTSDTAPDTIKKAIADNKNESILWELLNAGQAVINNAQSGIGDIKDQIEQLKGKIYPKNFTSIPRRMKDLANLLKV